MGAKFTAATPTPLTRSSGAITGYSFCMGCWVYVINNSTATSSSLSLSSVNSDFFSLTVGVTFFNVQANSVAAGNVTKNSTTAPVIGNWYFTMARFISATSRWIIVFDPSTGLVTQVQDVVSCSPAACNRFGIGTNADLALGVPSSNIIAEWFLMDSDVPGIATGTALAAEWVAKLALEGPFSRPEISDRIVEYKSFLSGFDTAVQNVKMTIGEEYSRIGLQTWANPSVAANVPIAAPHPPLSTNYVRPNQLRWRPLIPNIIPFGPVVPPASDSIFRVRRNYPYLGRGQLG